MQQQNRIFLHLVVVSPCLIAIYDRGSRRPRLKIKSFLDNLPYKWWFVRRYPCKSHTQGIGKLELRKRLLAWLSGKGILRSSEWSSIAHSQRSSWPFQFAQGKQSVHPEMIHPQRIDDPQHTLCSERIESHNAQRIDCWWARCALRWCYPLP